MAAWDKRNGGGGGESLCKDGPARVEREDAGGQAANCADGEPAALAGVGEGQGAAQGPCRDRLRPTEGMWHLLCPSPGEHDSSLRKDMRGRGGRRQNCSKR